MSKTLLLIGQTGSGKSTLGNLLIGDNVFQTSGKFNSCTSETVKCSSQMYNFLDVIDTPGLSDTYGKDQTNTQKMTEFLKNLYDNRSNINLVLVVINSKDKRFDNTMKKMIYFLCNVFPVELSHHIGIAFTFYNHERERNKYGTDEDPRLDFREDYVPEIMKIISSENNEELNLNPPVFFMDSKKVDRYTKEEVQRLLGWTKSLSPMPLVRVCDNKFKKVEPMYETIPKEVMKNGRKAIVETTYRYYQCTGYDGRIVNLGKEKISEIVTYKDMKLPEMEETKENSQFSLAPGLLDFFHAWRALKQVEQMEDEQGYSFPFLEKMFLLVMGTQVSKNEFHDRFKFK